MNPRREVVPVTTDSGGAATAFSPVLSGKVVNIIYTADGTSPFDNTADFTITAEATGQALWSATNVAASTTVAPRQAIHSVAGVAALYASGGTAINDDIVVAQDRVKIVIAQGGNVKTGSFTIITA